MLCFCKISLPDILQWKLWVKKQYNQKDMSYHPISLLEGKYWVEKYESVKYFSIYKNWEGTPKLEEVLATIDC